jgi:nifR3 family TIM-barrel protein
VDINCGCSVRKVLKSGSGSSLMRTPELAGRIFTAVRRAIDVPLTIKIRTGWTPDGAQALELTRIAADCGVDAIAVHPRTATQGFRGRADWSLIGRIKRRVLLPVIGNGDVRTPRDAARMLAETGCDAVMVGRAAVGNPFLFTQINAHLRGEPIPEPTLAARFAIVRRYVNASVDHIGEAHACRILRSRLTWFVSGLPHSSRFRQCVTRLASKAQALDTIAAYEACLAAGEPFDPARSGSDR